jgi:Asp/Glu/Hydantoin racemase
MLGVLMLQTRFPRPPGDIGHPDTFDFPVRRVVVAGATPSRVVRQPDASLLAPFIIAGQALVADGATALTTSCGFLARWQAELQAALPVPVWTSALLHLAALPGQRCGVITIDAAALSPEVLRAVDADPATPVEGITPGSPLHRTLLQDLPTLDADDARAQVLAAGARLRARVPGLQALVLECTNLPPYADALRQASGLPVHDITTLLRQRMGAA